MDQKNYEEILCWNSNSNLKTADFCWIRLSKQSVRPANTIVSSWSRFSSVRRNSNFTFVFVVSYFSSRIYPCGVSNLTFLCPLFLVLFKKFRARYYLYLINNKLEGNDYLPASYFSPCCLLDVFHNFRAQVVSNCIVSFCNRCQVDPA